MGLPLFKRCLNCKRVLVSEKLAPGKQVPTVSKFPYCLPCFRVKANDPEFNLWVKKQIHATNSYRNKPN